MQPTNPTLAKGLGQKLETVLESPSTGVSGTKVGMNEYVLNAFLLMANVPGSWLMSQGPWPTKIWRLEA